MFRMKPLSSGQLYGKLRHSSRMPTRPPKRVAMLMVLLQCVATSAIHTNEGGIAPTIDYSHNMRVLKLPKSTRPGEIIYRLRASDADQNDRLHFGVVGAQGRALLDIVPTPGNWKEADVYLRHQLEVPLDLEGVETGLQHHQAADQLLAAATQLDDPLYMAVYNLTIFVADASNKTTRVESTLLITNDDLLEQPEDLIDQSNYEPPAGGDPLEQTRLLQQAGSSNPFELTQRPNSSLVMKLNLPGLTRPKMQPQPQQSVQLSPFIRPRHVFTVSENGQPGESIGFLTVRERDKSNLPAKFELRGQGADHFGIRYVFGPRGQSRAELVLSQQVDYERQNLFKLKVLALNAWTNVRYDTRNVATLDIVIVVGDVQDTPPHFKQLPPALLISSQMRPGDLVAQFEAEDGDFGDQRPIGYALDASSPLSSFFTIDKLSGELRLSRPWQELSLQQQSLMMRLAGAAAATAASASAPNLSQAVALPVVDSHQQRQQPLSAPWLLQLSVFASELPDASSYDHLWPPMFARAELPVQLVDLVNEPPRLVGGLLTETSDVSGSHGDDRITVPTLRAFIGEFSNRDEVHSEPRHNSPNLDRWPSGQLVQWYISKNYSAETRSSASSPDSASSQSEIVAQLVRTSRGRPMLVDFGQGSNGTFELTLEGPDAHLFELEPSYPVNKLSLFNLFVAQGVNRSLFDFDAAAGIGAAAGGDQEQPMRSFHVEVVARDFGLAQRQTTRVKCLIDLVDINDNAPQFDQDLYTFSVFENAQLGQILGSIRARDMDKLGGIAGVLSGQYQRVRYTSLTGRDSNLFRLDSESGLITLEGALDREKQDHFLLIAEARDLSGQMANYTKILINVLDVNDNAPIFSQSHYDAVLLPDGTFHQPLVVAASDADEPSSANSQVAYEIIAGNQNDQFAIDALSGAIYPTGNTASSGGSASRPNIQIPSILSEPILPFVRTNQKQPDQHGKILPSPGAIDKQHEVEETTASSMAHKQSPLRLNWPRSALEPQTPIPTTSRPQTEGRFAANAPKQPQQQHFDATKVAPVTTLVVRAHDFGIPLRSATCKVTIYNQALLSRSLSVILNGTADQLEQRRDLIERSFGALTGSRVKIESIDALSDSSSISVARLKLAIPAGHSLIDLTDLSALMTALDYKPSHGSQTSQPNQQQQSLNDFRQPIHYITTGDRVYPVHGAPISGNISASGTTSSTSTTNTAIFTDFSPLDQAASQLERKLLFYIIIVGICILALLVIWMIYFCCREDQSRQLKNFDPYESSMKARHARRANRSVATGSFAADSNDSLEAGAELGGNNPKGGRHFGRSTAKSSSKMHLMDDQHDQQQHSMVRSASQLVLDQQDQRQHATSNKTLAKTTMMSAQHPIGNNLLKQQQQQLSILSNLKPEHLSMYNGQVWFEQGGLMRPTANGGHGFTRLAGRRASSAPSGSGRSLDSGLHAIINGAGGRLSAVSPINSGLTTPQQRRGQFFPNTLGYARNLANIETSASEAFAYPASDGRARQRNSLLRPRGRIFPVSMLGRPADGSYTNEAFEGGGLVMVPFVAGQQQSSTDAKRHKAAATRAKPNHRHHRKSSKSSSSSSGSRSDSTRTLDEEDELDHESVLLDSDQELLGFDSTGTPIIATRTRQQPATHSTRIGNSYLLAPGERTSEQNAGTGTSSPAATVINMSQATKTNSAGQKEEVENSTEFKAKQKPNEEAKVSDKEKVPTESKIDTRTTVANSKARQTMDLMSELNERLSSANKQHALKRQASGEEQHVEPPQRDATKQVIDQAARVDTHQSLPRLQDQVRPVASDTNNIPSATDESSNKAKVQQTSSPTTSAYADDEAKRKQAAFAARRASETMSYQSRSTVSEATTSETTTNGGDQNNRLKDMKNGELLEKQSIFALTYNQLATDKVPS